tara:strand:- start:7 stop:282 length:276 start_codon:yes stop_codon:yes gene_type:complete
MGGFVRRIFKAPQKILKKVIKPQGIEVAKQVDTKVADVQKEAANKVKGPTSVEMANQINIDNKRKGRKITNLTAKKTLDKDYKLSEKTLLG